jgi:hypothetical protein
MTPGLKPAPKVEPRGVGGVRAREAVLDETEPLGFRPYCFL